VPNSQGGYLCNCVNGFSGTNCEISPPNSIDPCTYNYCQNGGVCVSNNEGGYTCNCVNGFSGTNCQVNLQQIAHICLSQCQNGGACVPSGYFFYENSISSIL
jgi:Notch-like protein